MNELTKEELRLLFGALSLWMEEIYPYDNNDRKFRNDLYNKMQSMIDNYCDHIAEPSYEICCTKCQKTLL